MIPQTHITRHRINRPRSGPQDYKDPTAIEYHSPIITFIQLSTKVLVNGIAACPIRYNSRGRIHCLAGNINISDSVHKSVTTPTSPTDSATGQVLETFSGLKSSPRIVSTWNETRDARHGLTVAPLL